MINVQTQIAKNEGKKIALYLSTTLIHCCVNFIILSSLFLAYWQKFKKFVHVVRVLWIPNHAYIKKQASSLQEFYTKYLKNRLIWPDSRVHKYFRDESRQNEMVAIRHEKQQKIVLQKVIQTVISIPEEENTQEFSSKNALSYKQVLERCPVPQLSSSFFLRWLCRGIWMWLFLLFFQGIFIFSLNTIDTNYDKVFKALNTMYDLQGSLSTLQSFESLWMFNYIRNDRFANNLQTQRRKTLELVFIIDPLFSYQSLAINPPVVEEISDSSLQASGLKVASLNKSPSQLYQKVNTLIEPLNQINDNKLHSFKNFMKEGTATRLLAETSTFNSGTINIEVQSFIFHIHETARNIIQMGVKAAILGFISIFDFCVIQYRTLDKSANEKILLNDLSDFFLDDITNGFKSTEKELQMRLSSFEHQFLCIFCVQILTAVLLFGIATCAWMQTEKKWHGSEIAVVKNMLNLISDEEVNRNKFLTKFFKDIFEDSWLSKY